jgi:acyl carrier protein
VTTQDTLRTFIIEELQCDLPPGQLTDEYPLIDEQVIDSMGIYEIVTFIENEYGVEVLDDELLPEHFETINAIANLIDSRKG